MSTVVLITLLLLPLSALNVVYFIINVHVCMTIDTSTSFTEKVEFKHNTRFLRLVCVIGNKNKDEINNNNNKNEKHNTRLPRLVSVVGGGHQHGPVLQDEVQQQVHRRLRPHEVPCVHKGGQFSPYYIPFCLLFTFFFVCLSGSLYVDPIHPPIYLYI